MLRFYKLKIYDFISRFSGANVVVTAPKKTKGGRELQLASMSALTSKASSQHFFLRILKVIIQLREAARSANKPGGKKKPGKCWRFSYTHTYAD